MTNDEIFLRLKDNLKDQIEENNLAGSSIDITCRALSSTEAIGKPDHDDYPIVKGKEVMIEAVFKGASGQAFTDEFSDSSFPIEKLLIIDHQNTRDRATFVAGLNAIYKYLGLCEKTVHCRNQEPVDCANHLVTLAEFQGKKILQVGYQPRFLEMLLKKNQVRVLDLDPDNIGQIRFGVLVESTPQYKEAADWCDLVFATGSTLVNGTISTFINQPKPVIFYGVTIDATACILDLKTYCHCGH